MGVGKGEGDKAPSCETNPARTCATKSPGKRKSQDRNTCIRHEHLLGLVPLAGCRVRVAKICVIFLYLLRPVLSPVLLIDWNSSDRLNGGIICPLNVFFIVMNEQVGAVETRFRRKCMTVLLALCPLVVGKRGHPTPSSEEGTRTWIWQRLAEAGGRGVTEAVRVFETAPVTGNVLPDRDRPSSSGSEARSTTTTAGFPSGVGEKVSGGQEVEREKCERVATIADCYQFACETGVITPDELFLRDTGGNVEVTADAVRGKSKPGASKKRKATVGVGAEGGDNEEMGAARETTTPPRILRSLAAVVKCFGKFLEIFPVQSLVAGERDGSSSTSERAGRGNDSGEYDVTAKRKGSKAPRCPRTATTPIDDPGLLPTDRAAARLARAVLLRRGFNLMGTCLAKSAKPDEMAAVMVREGLWSQEMHRVLVYALVWPWAGGILPRASDGDEVEICKYAAVVACPLISRHVWSVSPLLLWRSQVVVRCCPCGAVFIDVRLPVQDKIFLSRTLVMFSRDCPDFAQCPRSCPSLTPMAPFPLCRPPTRNSMCTTRWQFYRPPLNACCLTGKPWTGRWGETGADFPTSCRNCCDYSSPTSPTGVVAE